MGVKFELLESKNINLVTYLNVHRVLYPRLIHLILKDYQSILCAERSQIN